MEEAILKALQWLEGHWGWVVGVFCVFFEVAPIKIHPITSMLSWLGRKLTDEIRKDIAELKKDTDANYVALEKRLADNEKALDMQRMANIKTLVLDFANTCRNGHRHTKEEFDYVLSENGVYETLVEKYNIKNDVYKEDYKYVKKIYQECLDQNNFLA